jgi:hypothetical protein
MASTLLNSLPSIQDGPAVLETEGEPATLYMVLAENLADLETCLFSGDLE